MVVEIGSRNPYDICDIVDVNGECLRITRREYMRRKMQGDITLRGCHPSFQPEDFRSELMRKYGKERGRRMLSHTILAAISVLR